MSAEFIRCLTVPLQGMNLLLPHTVVAEVVSGSSLQTINQVPDWLLGEIAWHQRNVPVVHLETLLILPQAQPDTHCPVLICHSLDAQASYPFIGILTNKMPRLTQVSAVNISAQAIEVEYQHAPLQAKLMLNNTVAYIPDLPALDKRLAAIHE